MFDLDFVNEVAPKHGRTSCKDEDLNGNQYFNEMGWPRCTRCVLLHRLREGKWPHNATFRAFGFVAVKEDLSPEESPYGPTLDPARICDWLI